MMNENPFYSMGLKSALLREEDRKRQIDMQAAAMLLRGQAQIAQAQDPGEKERLQTELSDSVRNFLVAQDEASRPKQPKGVLGTVGALARNLTTIPVERGPSPYQQGLYSQLQASAGLNSPQEQADLRERNARADYYEQGGRGGTSGTRVSLSDLEDAKQRAMLFARRKNEESGEWEVVDKDALEQAQKYQRAINKLLGEPEAQTQPSGDATREIAKLNVTQGSPGVDKGTGAGALAGVAGALVGAAGAQKQQQGQAQPKYNAAEGYGAEERKAALEQTQTEQMTRPEKVDIPSMQADYVNMARNAGADDRDIAKLIEILNSGDEEAIQQALSRLQGK